MFPALKDIMNHIYILSYIFMLLLLSNVLVSNCFNVFLSPYGKSEVFVDGW